MRCKDFYIGSGLPEDNSTTYYVLVLLMAIGIIVFVVHLGVPLPLILYPRGGEVTRNVT
jgi:hypothetical protein